MSSSLYIYTNGRLSRKDNSLFYKDLEGRTKRIPIENVKDIYFFGEIDFNTKVINLLSQYGLIVHFFNYYSYYVGSLYPKATKLSGKLLVQQVDHYQNDEKRLYIAKELINSASFNIYRNIRYYQSRGKNLKKQFEDISRLRNMIEHCESIQELMGVEGSIRKVYYQCFEEIIDQDIQFNKRTKRPPDNMINTLISFVNSIIYTRVVSEIYKTHLNPTISYLHEPGESRLSLSLDIAEIFKPIIGDRVIFSLLNKNRITEDDFTEGLNYLHLKKSASQLIMKEIDDSLNRTIMHKGLNRKVSYEYLIRLEGYKLIKHLIGEKEYEGFKMWW